MAPTSRTREDEDKPMRCARCGSELSARDAEAADNLPLSESDALVHRESTTCEGNEVRLRTEIMQAMHELEDEGIWEIQHRAEGDDDAVGDTVAKT